MRRDESGQSLLVIVSSMTVLLAMAGFGIDTASWMVRHHNAQVVADSAALAAAQCLASPNQSSTMFVNGSQTTVPKCTSATDSADAQTVAVDYAAANGLAITAANVSVDTTKKVVTVTATTSSPGIFAKVFGMASSTESAHAGAGWKPGGCTVAGQNCDFMFANSDNCPGIALNVATQGAATINGDIQTNGGLDASGTGNGGGIYGTGNFGPGACTSTTGGNHDPWQTSQPTQASSLITWPIDYSKDFPACGGNGESACVNGYPSFCTVSGYTITVNNQIVGDQPQADQVYCASGPPPAKPSDPSTWTGSVTLNMSGNNPIEDTFVGGTISYTGNGGDTISPCGYTASGYSSSSCSAPAPAGNTSNYPVFYAISTDPSPAACAAGTNVATSCAFSITSGGNLTLDGDTFVENGTASLNFQGNQSAGNTFFEANSITATLNGNFNGDGPPPGSNGSGSGGSGSVSLVQ
jgi:hypothetical protein